MTGRYYTLRGKFGHDIFNDTAAHVGSSCLYIASGMALSGQPGGSSACIYLWAGVCVVFIGVSASPFLDRRSGGVGSGSGRRLVFQTEKGGKGSLSLCMQI